MNFFIHDTEELRSELLGASEIRLVQTPDGNERVPTISVEYALELFRKHGRAREQVIREEAEREKLETQREVVERVKGWIVHWNDDEHDNFSNMEGVVIVRLANEAEALRQKLKALHPTNKQQDKEQS